MARGQSVVDGAHKVEEKNVYPRFGAKHVLVTGAAAAFCHRISNCALIFAVFGCLRDVAKFIIAGRDPQRDYRKCALKFHSALRFRKNGKSRVTHAVFSRRTVEACPSCHDFQIYTHTYNMFVLNGSCVIWIKIGLDCFQRFFNVFRQSNPNRPNHPNHLLDDDTWRVFVGRAGSGGSELGPSLGAPSFFYSLNWIKKMSLVLSSM